MGGGRHDVAVPSHGSTAGTPGPEEANLPRGPLTPGAISAGAVIDPPPVLFSGLEPPRLETTGERVTGADTPKHRIENKRRRSVLFASQQPQTQWSVYQGDFDLTDPVAPLETHRGEMCPAGLALHHPAANLLKEWATYGCPTQTGKPWTREEMQAAIERALTAQLFQMRQSLTSRQRSTKKSASGRLSSSRGTPSRTTLPPS